MGTVPGQRIHEFESTQEAYNATQTDDNIQDGDTLIIPSEKVVGVAMTWPFAVTWETGALHKSKAPLRDHGDRILSYFKSIGITGEKMTKEDWALKIKEAYDLAVDREWEVKEW